MSKKISKFYYTMVAFTIVQFSSLLCGTSDGVFAAAVISTIGDSELISSICGTSTSWAYYSAYCGIPDANGHCATSLSFCASYQQPGWSCSGYGYGDGYLGTGTCDCSSASAVSYIMEKKDVNCGAVYVCRISASGSESCDTSSSSSCYEPATYAFCNREVSEMPGYRTGAAGYQSCVCCPGANEISGSSEQVSVNYSNYAVSDCYVVGNFADYSGLFEYTNDNKCYYKN